jgi:YVTN family beta-propeller protein
MFKRILSIAALCMIAAGAAAQPGAKPGAKPVIYVGNSFGDDIAAIDAATGKTIATIKVGQTVHAICAQADGRKVFTTVESAKTLNVIDTATNKVTDTIALPGQPNQCAATADGRYVVVPIIAPQNLAAIVDMRTKQVVKTLPVRHPHNCVSPERGSNEVIYCEARDNSRIDRIDMKTLEFTRQVPVGGDPRPFIVTADEKTLYTALSGLHGFATVDTVKQTIAEVVLPAMPYMECKGEPPNTPTHGIALTPDGTKLWITSVGDAGVYIYDLAARRMSKKLATGACPNWISISRDGKYAAISNADSGDVSIFDVRSEKELARPKSGAAPKRLLIVDVPTP